MASPTPQTPNTIPTKRLAQSITSAATTFTIDSILDWAGNDLAAGSFGTIAYGAFRDANSTVLEIFSYDPSTIATGTLTFVTRGLPFSGALATSVSANKLNWTKGTLVELGTNLPQLFDWLKEYIDAASIAGAVPSTTSVLGVVKMSVAPASAPSPIAVGDNDPRMLTANEKLAATAAAAYTDGYAADSQGSDTYVVTLSPVPPALTAGLTLRFKANTANTGAATLNVNSLGAIAIVKYKDLPLSTGDIKAGQIVEVSYDGTNFQLLSKVPPMFSNGVTTRQMDTASGAVTIAHGLGTTPRSIRVTARIVNTAATAKMAMSDGVYNGTTTACVWLMRDDSTASTQGTDTTNIVHIVFDNTGEEQNAVATFDSTNITLTWTKTGSPPTTVMQIMWEAYA